MQASTLQGLNGTSGWSYTPYTAPTANGSHATPGALYSFNQGGHQYWYSPSGNLGSIQYNRNAADVQNSNIKGTAANQFFNTGPMPGQNGYDPMRANLNSNNSLASWGQLGLTNHQAATPYDPASGMNQQQWMQRQGGLDLSKGTVWSSDPTKSVSGAAWHNDSGFSNYLEGPLMVAGAAGAGMLGAAYGLGGAGQVAGGAADAAIPTGLGGYEIPAGMAASGAGSSAGGLAAAGGTAAGAGAADGLMTAGGYGGGMTDAGMVGSMPEAGVGAGAAETGIPTGLGGYEIPQGVAASGAGTSTGGLVGQAGSGLGSLGDWVGKGVGQLGSYIQNNPLGTMYGLGQLGLRLYQQNQLNDIADQASKRGNALDQPQRAPYQNLLNQYYNGGQDITKQPAVAAELAYMGRQASAKLAQQGMNGAGNAPITAINYANEALQRQALPYLSQLGNLAGFNQGPGYSGNLYGQYAAGAAGAPIMGIDQMMAAISGNQNWNPTAYQAYRQADNNMNGQNSVSGATTQRTA